jgi:hypothetical protein
MSKRHEQIAQERAAGVHWGVAFGADIYVMSEPSAREVAHEGLLMHKIDGEWVAAE